MDTPHLAPVAALRGAARIVAALLMVGCAKEQGVTDVDPELALGTWGGANAAAIVTDTLAHVHIACTFGDIPGRLSVDGKGHFSRAGSYVLRAYPVYVGPTLPAQFSGDVSGSTLVFTVVVNDTVNKQTVTLGPATVVFGKDPQMGPCPVCAVPGARQRMVPLPQRQRP